MWRCEDVCSKVNTYTCCHYCDEKETCENECGLEPLTCHYFINDEED